MKLWALSTGLQTTTPCRTGRPKLITFQHRCGRALARRLLPAAAVLFAALLLAVPAARAETDPPDLAVALATLDELEARGAAAWTDTEAEAYFAARAAIDAQLRQDPEGPDAQAWFAGLLVDAESGVESGWLLYTPALVAAIAARAEILAMDRALWFAWLVTAPWGINPIDGDPCLAVKAFTLQGTADLSTQDARMASAIPAVAEAERLRLWSLNEQDAAVLAGLPFDQEAVDRAALTSQIITEMLLHGAADLDALQQGFFFDSVTGRPYTEAEIAEAFAGLDEETRIQIAAASPFFSDLQKLFALPPDQAVAHLCR